MPRNPVHDVIPALMEANETATPSLPALLLQRLRDRHDRPQIKILPRFGAPQELSGRDLLSTATALIAQWQDCFGPAPRTFVLALPPGELFLSALLAGLLGGFTVVPVSPPRSGSRTDRLMHIVQDCRADAVLCSDSTRDGVLQRLRPAKESEPACPIAVLDGTPPTVTSLDGRPRHADRPDAPHPAVIMYTSGSTHLPKGVRIFGDQIVANCDLVARTWDMNPTTRFVNWLPHFHDMGLMGGILYPLLTGAYSVQLAPLDMIRKPAFWLRAISDHRATFSGGPAFAFADCLRRITPEDCQGLDLSSWGRAFCGAEPIPAGLLPAFRARFAPHGLRPDAVFGCYGMAEITLFAAGAPESGRDLPPPPPHCSAVHPCLLTDTTRPNLRIVDPASGRARADGEPGEIWLRGPSKGEGYMNQPEDSALTFNATLTDTGEAGWLRTGDLGVVADDLLYVTGRLKDVFIVNGRNIAAAEIEWLAGSLDDALNPLAAAAFTPDPMDSTVATLLIELKPGRTAPAHPETVRTTIERTVMGEWGIRLGDLRILPRGKLERTSSGKIRRQAIADAYRRGEIPPAHAPLHDDEREKVRST